MRGGFSGFWRGVLRATFGAVVGRGRAVLPRNSGVFGLGEGTVRRFSARRTPTGTRCEKIFKNLLERGEKPGKWGARGAGRWREGTLYRVCEAIFRRDF